MADHISIVIPTRNRAPMLRQALRCAKAQTWKDIEIIVVDEGSTDDTPRMLESEFSSLRVIRHDHPMGPSAARNAAIGAASGGWVFFLDDDDLMHPHHLEDLLQASRAAPPRSLVAGRMRNFALSPGADVVLGPVICAPPERTDIEMLNELIDPTRQRTITLSSVLWPRSMFDRLAWDENLSFNEDCDLFVQAVLDGWRVIGRPIGKFFIRIHPSARVTTTMDSRRLRSPILSRIKWAGLLKADPRYAACGQALRDGIMVQFQETAFVPQTADLRPRLKQVFRDWGGDQYYLLNPPGNALKRAALQFVLQVGGPGAVQRLLALFARLR